MARPLRILVENGIYHVTSRGLDKRDIFLDDRDRATFLSITRSVCDEVGWQWLTYCLMPNHFHLLVRTPQANLPRGMQRIKARYAEFHNPRHGRGGPLYSKRYDARLVQADDYLCAALRYIARNPVKDGFCGNPLDWRWSGHAELAGCAEGPGRLDVAATLRLLDHDPHEARRRYLLLTASGDEAGAWDGPVLGSDDFARNHLPDRKPALDVAVRDWGRGRPPLSELLVTGSVDELRLAFIGHGYPLSEIGGHLGCHPRTVQRRMREP